MKTTKTQAWQDLALPLKQRWLALKDGERSALRLLGAALLLMLAWLIAVQPALRTLPPVPAAQAAQALQAASEHLGSGARLTITGERAVLTLTGISSEALQAWLGEARSAARARPVEAQLQRGPKEPTQ